MCTACSSRACPVGIVLVSDTCRMIWAPPVSTTCAHTPTRRGGAGGLGGISARCRRVGDELVTIWRVRTVTNWWLCPRDLVGRRSWSVALGALPCPVPLARCLARMLFAPRGKRRAQSRVASRGRSSPHPPATPVQRRDHAHACARGGGRCRHVVRTGPPWGAAPSRVAWGVGRGAWVRGTWARCVARGAWRGARAELWAAVGLRRGAGLKARAGRTPAGSTTC